VQEFLAKKRTSWFSTPFYSPDLILANLFLSPTLRKELADPTLFLDKFKTKWEGSS
jgi:hypothetical protein